MISLSAAQARIKRAKIRELAGFEFIEGEQVLTQINYFNDIDAEQPLFALKKSATLWTAVFVNWIYCSVEGRISVFNIEIDTQALFEYFSQHDFSEYAYLEGNRTMWMLNGEVCQQILNVMLMLEKVPNGERLQP